MIVFQLLDNFAVLLPNLIGGHSEDTENEEEDQQCPTADRIGGDFEKFIYSFEEDD